MIVRKVGTEVDVPIKMTRMDEKRIMGTFGYGSVTGSSDSFTVPVQVTDGQPSVRSVKLTSGQHFFKRGAVDKFFIFQSYDADAAH